MAGDADVTAVITARDEASSTLRGVGSSMGGLVGQFALGNIVANAAQKAWSSLETSFKNAISTYEGIQNLQNQINQELKDTHDISGMTAQSINNYATKLSETTPISKEAALAGDQVLLKYNAIGSEVFPKAQQAVADLAESMAHGGTVSADDMASAAQRLGVALDDPSSGMGRLKLAGIALTKEQADTIKALQKSGDVLGAQKLLLDDVTAAMGGSAVNAAKTLSGQIEVLRQKFMNIEEAIVGHFINALKEAGVWLLNHKELALALAGALTALALVLTGMVVTALGTAIAGFISLNAAALPWIGLAVAIGAGVAAMGYIVVKNWNAIKSAIQPVINLLKNDLWPIIKTILDIVVNQFKKAWDDLKGSFDKLWVTLSPYKQYLIDLAEIIGVTLLAPILLLIGTLAGVVVAITAIITIGARLIGWISEAVAWVVNFDVNFVKAFADIFSEVTNEGKLIFDWFTQLPVKILDAMADAGTWLYNVGKDIIDGLLHGMTDAIGGIGSSIGNVASDIGGAVKGALHAIHIPGFASGGIIPATPGGQLIVAGEGGQNEAIIPLPNGSNSLAGLGNNTTNNNVTVNVTVQAQAFMGSQYQARQFAQSIWQALQDVASSKNTTVAKLVLGSVSA